MGGVLSRGPSRWRDWTLFVLIASLPALALGALAFRALRNEEAAVRRELRLELEQAAAEVQQSYRRELEAEGERPLFADPVRLDPLAAPVAPRVGVDAEERGDDGGCRELIDALAAGRAGRSERARILADCREATTDGDRFAWPLVALDDAEPHPSSDELAAWIDAHAARMSAAERAVTRRELAAADWLPGELRQRLGAALDGAPLGTPATSYLEAHRLAMMAAVPLLEWTDASSRGVARRTPEGIYQGYVVHPGSLSRALRGGWPRLPAGTKARLFVGREPDEEARVELLPGGAWLTLGWSDPETVARSAARSRAVVIGAAMVAGALALGLAGLLFARMRAERRLSALRTDFVAAVSHELRTPIASLRMLSELLADDKIEPGERSEVHHALAREARRLGDTVERLLGFSRMQAHKPNARRQARSVAEIVAEAIDTFEERHPEDAPVVRRLDESAVAPIDAESLRMAVDNLLENAHKHAPGGTPYEVTVERAGAGVRVAVRDAGPGIARRDQKRIFRPFERADDRLSRATEGSGIGLSLVRHVAQSHGGDARVESAPGKGACFVLTIGQRS